MSFDRLNDWITAEAKARRHFAQRYGLTPDEIDIQRALLAVIGSEEPTDILRSSWTAESLIATLADVDFVRWRDYEVVELEQSLLPADSPRRLDEETIKFRNEIWRIHKYDPDPFPFLPHAHNYYDGIKLDLRDGKLYRKRKLLSQIGKRELIAFRARVLRTPLPDLIV